MNNGFRPINVLKGRDETGQENDPIKDGVNALEVVIPEQKEEAVMAPPVRPQPQTPIEPMSSGFRPIPNSDKAVQMTKTEEAKKYSPFLPKNVEVGSYSANDLSTNDELYSIVEDFMLERQGIQSVEGKTKEEVVNLFLNNRRGVAMAGNSVRVLQETAHMKDVKESGDSNRLNTMAKGYALYENMAGITSDETSWGEALGATGDVVRGVLLDPVNVASLGIGKVVGGVATKAGIKTLEKYIMKEAGKQLANGATKATIKASSAAITRTAIAASKKEGTEAVAKFAASMAATKGRKRILTKAGIAEIGASTLVDAVAGSGFEYLYQEQLVDSGVQDEVNPYSVGLAALGAIAIGGVSAARTATRGMSNTALVSEEVGQGTVANVAASMRKDIRKHYGDLMKDKTSWASKVEAGTELNVQDTEFFIELLLGQTNKEGDEVFGGLASKMQEEGFFFVRKDEEDTVSNFIAEFIKSMDPEDVKGIVKDFEDTLGVSLKGLRDVTDANGVTKTLDEVTPESFAQAFAKKMRNNARGLNSASQVASNLGVKLKDLDVDTYVADILGLKMMKEKGKPTKLKSVKMVEAGQNRFIRSLVSHPSTSMLNVLGWGVSSGLGSTNEILRSVMYLGRGQLDKLMGDSVRGAEKTTAAWNVIKANANRVNLMLDPDMTAAAFNSALERNSGALDKLKRVQSGGVDVSVSVDDVLDRTVVGGIAEKYIDAAQTATFVHAQDTFTKSQEYIFQMDKGLRDIFGKSYNEFYRSEGANKIMATKEYKKLEEGAIERVMEHTFSKTYKQSNSNLVKEVGGFLEDARNIPGLGMMIPFGRFFNNTVDFAMKNTGAAILAKRGGMYADKSAQELWMQGAIGWGLIATMAQNEQEKRRQGLGMYDAIDPTSGGIISQQYDYPLSLFVASGRIWSYFQEGEAPPAELVAQFSKDFGVGGLSRNLTTTGKTLADAVTALMMGQIDEAAYKTKEAASNIGSQAIGGFTRSLEPLDTAIGLATGTEMRPQNVKDGNAFIGKSLMYVRNTAQLFSGEPMNDVLVSSAEGERDVQLDKTLGIRSVRPTNALRLMNLLAYDSWENNSSYVSSVLAGSAANEYNRMMFEEIDHVAEGLMDDPIFRRLKTDDQRQAWEEALTDIKNMVMLRLSHEYTGPQSTFVEQLELVNSNPQESVRSAMKELKLEGEIGDLTLEEIRGLRTFMDTQEDIDMYSAPYRIER